MLQQTLRGQLLAIRFSCIVLRTPVKGVLHLKCPLLPPALLRHPELDQKSGQVGVKGSGTLQQTHQVTRLLWFGSLHAQHPVFLSSRSICLSEPWMLLAHVCIPRPKRGPQACTRCASLLRCNHRLQQCKLFRTGSNALLKPTVAGLNR